jgi:predicted TPR repeat methyltransferase
LQGKSNASANLILAADAMCYVRDIALVLIEARRVLAPGGAFAFTLETHDGDGVVIGEGLRYAHGKKTIVREAVVAAGFGLAHLEEASPRTEDNEPVRGLVVVAVKPEAKT